MALRVLLADENVTIKKVLQLSLQDYAVNVKSVNIGLDVSEVALSFKPDIIFADILLQKKNGYDVCKELKANHELESIPLVLLWSGFMELDRERYSECGADAELEKPFEKTVLRKLINDLVPKTKESKIGDFLQMVSTPENDQKSTETSESPPPPAPTTLESTEKPAAPSLEEEPENKKEEKSGSPLDQFMTPPPATPVEPPVKPQTEPPPQHNMAPESSSESWSMESFDDIEEFVQQPLSEFQEIPPSTTDISTSPEVSGLKINEEEEQPESIQPLPPLPPPGDELTDHNHNVTGTEEWVQPPILQPLSTPESQIAPPSFEENTPELGELTNESNEELTQELTAEPQADQPDGPMASQRQEPEQDPEQEWIQGDLGKFKLNIPIDSDSGDDPDYQFNLDAMDEDVKTSIFVRQNEEIKLLNEDSIIPNKDADDPDDKTQEISQDFQSTPFPQLSETELEKLLRSQSKEIIESVVWKVVPDMAEKIIREELDRILKDSQI